MGIGWQENDRLAIRVRGKSVVAEKCKDMMRVSERNRDEEK